ncbi:MAG: CotH kinase family protein [Oscillospiraceae bacterium]
MSTNKHIDIICAAAAVVAFIIMLISVNAQALGIQSSAKLMGYENRLFDRSRVHTIDIVMDDWDGFIETVENEEYSVCSVVIDDEAYKNVAIRGKGNTSLSSVSQMNSDRYSFKIEFDHYDSTKTYYGLDKLCLNNIIQDNTYMKDYLAYTLMSDFGVAAPLCSYAYITVNGEDWGLYLAVEGVEDAFLKRNYGSDYGNLYKPDSLSFGGGRGNGKDFNMEDFQFDKDSGQNLPTLPNSSDTSVREPSTQPSEGGKNPFDFGNGMPDFSSGELPFGNQSEMPVFSSGEFPFGEQGEMPEFSQDIQGGKGGFGEMGGMGSSDVKLQYTDDEFDSYSNIFDSAKTDVSESDKKRLIASLKTLSEGSDVSSAVDVEQVIRYFVVHNFVCNGDSYTGSMIHNYYLYEEDGMLSMIPWDYNLAFGTFQGGNAKEQVNFPIDTPVSGGMDDRPMVAWIFTDEEYTELYHKLFGEFLSQTDFASIISETAELIADYVEKDPTKFCTYEEFETGVAAITQFCTLRAESVSGQLDGSIPSTSEGQSEDSSSLIDTGALVLSEMGSMNNGGNFGENRKDFNRNDSSQNTSNETSEKMSNTNFPSMNGNRPNGFPQDGENSQEFPPNNSDTPTSGGEFPDSQTSAPAKPDSENNGRNPSDNQNGSFTTPPNSSAPQMDQSMPQGEDNTVLLLIVSVTALVGGLLTAALFKR